MGIAKMILLKFTYGVSFWILGVIFILSRTIKRVLLGSFIFILASASVVVASIVGAIEGHTTDIGFLKGGLLGVLAGFITAVQLFGPLLHSDQPLAKIIAFDTGYMESSDFYDFDQERKGLSKSSIQNIPMFYNHSNHQTKSSCPICLQDWEEGEVGRKLERCGHRSISRDPMCPKTQCT
ncbi:PREDICTED: NEP1-interacting protein-like 2 [Camelina sativa]|uniref:NEP1-interacting protein-like 2 n=1 Tax=Camelina sativa TaxID=90675 RepID=A0ABM0Z0V8_CAMSA|nr:PREDICTED: NEP1-interacting protein-like 2 [Camelina sativa]